MPHALRFIGGTTARQTHLAPERRQVGQKLPHKIGARSVRWNASLLPPGRASLPYHFGIDDRDNSRSPFRCSRLPERPCRHKFRRSDSFCAISSKRSRRWKGLQPFRHPPQCRQWAVPLERCAGAPAISPCLHQRHAAWVQRLRTPLQGHAGGLAFAGLDAASVRIVAEFAHQQA